MAIEEGNLNCKIVVIDTTAYAGNFERELCAYLTGQIAECYVGEEFLESKESIKHLNWWEENINPQEDTGGSEFYRPCTIWKTGNSKDYKSVAIFVEEFPPQEVMDEAIQRAKAFGADTDKVFNDHQACKNNNIPKVVEITGYRFVKSEYTREITETKNETVVFKKKM